MWWFINLVDAWVKPLIPKTYLPETYLPFNVPGVGLIVGIFGLMVIGALTANLFGRTIVSYGEMMLDRMPVVRGVYRLVKQIFTTMFSKSGTSFKRVGLIEFPRRGLYCIVFLAGDPPQEVEEKIGGGKPLITVFMPNGPNPTTGFIVFMPAKRGDPARPCRRGRGQARRLGGSGRARPAAGRAAQARQGQGQPSRCPRKSRSI